MPPGNTQILPPKKSRRPLWAVVILILLTALLVGGIVGGGVYFYQREQGRKAEAKAVKKVRKELQSQVRKLKSLIRQLRGEIRQFEEKEAGVEEEVEERREERMADTTPPPTPRLLSPTDGALLDDPSATLRWTRVSDSSGVAYSVEIQEFAGGGVGFQPKVRRSGLVTPSYPHTFGPLLERWRVWAVDGAGNESGKTPWWTARQHTP